jgi:two-component system, NtrC family, response regulator PilR
MEKEKFKASILVIDDEEGMCRLLKGVLSQEGHHVKTITSSVKALSLLTRENFDVIITDIKMPGMDGVELLRNILKTNPDQAVVMITAYGSIESAVDAIKIGAYDYITKPFQTDQVIHAISKIIERSSLIEENKKLRTELDSIQSANTGVIGTSRAFMETVTFAKKIADSHLNVLITGESGTGKEVIAKLIHHESSRRDQAFIPVQCGVIPVNLMESELFGHRKGSFTGAHADKAGIFEEADGGTVFLDEIGDITQDIQAKLLRFLQEREIRKVGDTKSHVIDARLISATNKDLTALVQDKTFREDLYYRIKAVEIHLPPLRKRKEDIPLLVEYFLASFNKLRDRAVKIEKECFKYLLSYDWPGNIRELRNMIETSATICEQNKIRISDISYILHHEKKEYKEFLTFTEMKKRIIKDFEMDYISLLLKRSKGNISAAAREAGIDKKNLWDIMKKHSLSAASYKE